jgi:hypothetical protein
MAQSFFIRLLEYRKEVGGEFFQKYFWGKKGWRKKVGEGNEKRPRVNSAFGWDN